MSKRMLYIGCAVCISLLLIGTLLYFIPTSRTPIDITMDAVKSDSNGNELGIVQITVSGTVEKYLFRDACVSLDVTPFEDLYDIKQWDPRDYSSYGPNKDGWYNLWCEASSTEIGKNSYFIQIYFKEDLSQWKYICMYRPGAKPELEEDGTYRDLTFTYRAIVEE